MKTLHIPIATSQPTAPQEGDLWKNPQGQMVILKGGKWVRLEDAK